MATDNVKPGRQGLTIGKLAARVGMRTSALRYYEELGLLKPSRRSDSGYREYDADAEKDLRFIQRAQHLGFSLSDIQQLLEILNDHQTNDSDIVRIAEERYIALEKQITQLLTLQHELGLFLVEVDEQLSQKAPQNASRLLSKLIDHICTNPANQPANDIFDWLSERTGCVLNSDKARTIIESLRGQHIHVWQEQERYHILIASDDPEIGEALSTLAKLEAGCQVHAHNQQAPELMHNDEGYLLTISGENAFLIARLFLSFDQR